MTTADRTKIANSAEDANQAPGAERTRITDPALMRALAHPARLEILDHLSLSREGATATECATVVGLSPSATSYHLRALAKVGMIEEAPNRGDGRERVWQASRRQFSVGADIDAEADVIEAEKVIVEAFLARQNDQVRRFLAQARELPEWFEVASLSDQTILVTPAELKELQAKIEELVAPVKNLEREDPPEGAAAVTLQIRAVPRL